MTIVTIVEQNGSLSEKSVKDLNIDNYYKCCSYRKKDGFEKRTEWNVNINKKKLKVEVWSRNDGKANTENKYDFPPPIDNELYFGKCLVVCYEKNKVCDLSNNLWLKIYEHLFGGFESLGEEEEMSDDEEELKGKPVTKEVYLKDNFVVSDNDESDDDYNLDEDEDESSSEEYDKNYKKKNMNFQKNNII